MIRWHCVIKDKSSGMLKPAHTGELLNVQEFFKPVDIYFASQLATCRIGHCRSIYSMETGKHYKSHLSPVTYPQTKLVTYLTGYHWIRDWFINIDQRTRPMGQMLKNYR